MVLCKKAFLSFVPMDVTTSEIESCFLSLIVVANT